MPRRAPPQPDRRQVVRGAAALGAAAFGGITVSSVEAATPDMPTLSGDEIRLTVGHAAVRIDRRPPEHLVDAIDQPWKFFEGGVGPYWGILDANREPKFSWTGPIVTENYWKLAGR